MRYGEEPSSETINIIHQKSLSRKEAKTGSNTSFWAYDCRASTEFSSPLRMGPKDARFHLDGFLVTKKWVGSRDESLRLLLSRRGPWDD